MLFVFQLTIPTSVPTSSIPLNLQSPFRPRRPPSLWWPPTPTAEVPWRTASSNSNRRSTLRTTTSRWTTKKISTTFSTISPSRTIHSFLLRSIHLFLCRRMQQQLIREKCLTSSRNITEFGLIDNFVAVISNYWPFTHFRYLKSGKQN